jgi:hypothetical protein
MEETCRKLQDVDYFLEYQIFFLLMMQFIVYNILSSPYGNGSAQSPHFGHKISAFISTSPINLSHL